MAEKICVFGPGLVGILSQPTEKGTLEGAPAILLWNVGMNHRVGPYRFFVDLARRVASHAGTVFRFDVSGFGDSELQAGRGNDLERAQLDLQEAMSLLEKRAGVRRFILVGFCSSVDVAYQMAVRDERVAGVVFIEAYSFRTLSYYVNVYRKYKNPYLWRRFLTQKAEHAAELLARFRSPDSQAKAPGDAPAAGNSVFTREYPTRERFRDDVAALTKRGAALLFVYAGPSTEFNHKEQFYELFCTPDNRDKVDVIFYERADHTFSRVSDRERALGDIVTWVTRKFGKAHG